jgi:hypothetical protein
MMNLESRTHPEAIMNPVGAPGSKSLEIGPQGLFGRPREPFFGQQTTKVLVPVGVGILGVAFYWMFTYSGPYRYLAELQLKWMGFYSPKLTILLIFAGLFLGLLAIAAAIKLVFRGAERSISETHTPPIATPAMMPTAVQAPAVQAPDRWLQSCRLAIMYATPLLVVGIGAYSYYNGRHEGNLLQLTVADFESGRITARALYADVHGQLSDSYLSNDSYRYIPVLSKEKAAAPVTLMVGISDGDVLKYLHRDSDGAFTVRGVAEKGLPGDLRYAFEKNGIPVADPVWVVHAGRDPSWDRKTGLLIMGFGVALAAFLIAWRIYLKRKSAVRAVQATAI